MTEQPRARLDGADALEEISRRIQQDAPGVELTMIRRLLDAAYARTEGAKVQNFRLLLAEKEVRRRLRGEPTADHEATIGEERPWK
jgi:hypothetical protein